MSIALIKTDRVGWGMLIQGEGDLNRSEEEEGILILLSPLRTVLFTLK
jgi:hypothetical protein